MTRDRQDIIGCGSLLAIENGQIAAINYRLLTVCNGQGKNSCLNDVPSYTQLEWFLILCIYHNIIA